MNLRQLRYFLQVAELRSFTRAATVLHVAGSLAFLACVLLRVAAAMTARPLKLARLDPGARMVFEQRRVHGEVWLPSHARMQLAARLALVKKLRGEVEVFWRDYRKFQSDSRITEYTETSQNQ